MINHGQYQTVFIKGLLALDAEYEESEGVSTARLLIATTDRFMGDDMIQYHNVTAVDKAAIDSQGLKQGDGIEITGQILWLETEYVVETIENDRQAEIIAVTAGKSDDATMDNSYQRIFMKGAVIGEPQYTVDISGAITKSLLGTNDKMLGDTIEQNHSLLALNKVASKLKEYSFPCVIQATGQILWLDAATYTGEAIENDRSVEIIINDVELISNGVVDTDTRSREVDQNIKDLYFRMQNSGCTRSAAYRQAILNKLRASKQ